MRIGTKLALLYALFFGFSTLVLGGVSLFLIDRTLSLQVDDRISTEILALTKNPDAQSAADIMGRIVVRKTGSHKLHYILRDAAGTAILEDLPWTGTSLGWFDFVQAESDTSEIVDQFRGFAVKAKGYDLVVAEDTDEIENIRQIILGISALLAVVAAALAGGGGLWLSRFYMGKLEAFAERARAITAGDASRRMPVMASGDEFDSLSTSLNTMLDRNQELLALQRRVTSDIAHDMRTPLTRLRQKLENDPAHGTTVEDVDDLLRTMTGLLRIAEIEEGERHRNFRALDLADIARKVAEIYGPEFDTAGKTLNMEIMARAMVHGDADLLTQLVVNLVENVLQHTQCGTTATIAVSQDNTHVTLNVSDDGPGIPAGEEEKILERFYRLDKSRGTKGSGLGLNLVKAIADAHVAEVMVQRLERGLGVRVRLKRM